MFKGKIIQVIGPSVDIQFIEKEVWTKLWDIWTIDIMREFSFINLKEEDADFVLRKFKDLNPKKPLIVEAKSKDAGGSSSRGWFRWGSSSGGSRGGSGGWYRGGSSRGGSSSSSSRGWYKWNKG